MISPTRVGRLDFICRIPASWKFGVGTGSRHIRAVGARLLPFTVPATTKSIGYRYLPSRASQRERTALSKSYDKSLRCIVWFDQSLKVRSFGCLYSRIRRAYQGGRTFPSSPSQTRSSTGPMISPTIATRAFAHPKRSAGVLCAGSMGASFASGLQCLVIVISSPVCWTRSINSRHVALNSVAEISITRP